MRGLLGDFFWQSVRLIFGATMLCVILPTCSFAVADCLPQISVSFDNQAGSVFIESDKDISNLVLKFCDGSEDEKIEPIDKPTFFWEGKALAGVWVKSGCNQSNDGPGYGEFFGNRGACEEDCMGIPGGKAVYDQCGVCGGDDSSCNDCAGVPNGEAELDQCGVCDGDGTSCLGCDEVPNSGKVFDACGVCGGDNSSCLDCAGVPNGETEIDQCGVCGGDNSSCLDCAGIPNGDSRIDDCGVCGGDGSSCVEISECQGKVDKCGVCNGNNACLDCAGIPNGGTKIDCCGVCGGDGSSCLDQCKQFSLKGDKRKMLRELRALYSTVRKYNRQQGRCGANKRVVRARMQRAKLLFEMNKSLLEQYIPTDVKLCQTAFCTRTTFKPMLQTVSQNSRSLLRLSRQAQYGSIKACGASRFGRSRASQRTYRQIASGIGRLPNERCD